MIHQYKSNGYNIVLDVESGLVHVTDEMAYDAIMQLNEELSKKYESISNISAEEVVNAINKIKTSNQNNILSKYRDEKLEKVWNDIESLVMEGKLFSPDVYKDYINELSMQDSIVKALCFHVAHDCNLACKYCFADEGEYQGKRELMSLEVGKKALDFLVSNSGNRHNLEIDFFGGEPLMNWQVVKDIVVYGRQIEKKYKKNFRFTLTTNGVLLDDEVMKFANLEMDNVVLSLDGRKEINDKMRPTINGKGSYDVVVPKFQKFVKNRKDKDYFIRGTFTKDNLDFTNDVLHFVELGFKQISIEPVVTKDEDKYAIDQESLEIVFNEYDNLAKEMVKRQGSSDEFNFFHFSIDLDGGPCVAKRLSACGAGYEYLAVTPSGDLYPCHQFVGHDEFLLGNVNEGIIKPEIQMEFRNCNVYSKNQCVECFAKFYCSGGCMANSYDFHGNINKIYEIGCEMMKKRVECAIMLKIAKLMQED